MPIRTSLWDRSVELGTFDHWVITSRPRWTLHHWLESRFTVVAPERLFVSIDAALREVRERDVAQIWHCLFPYSESGPLPPSIRELLREVLWKARSPSPTVFVLERLIERGSRTTAPTIEAQAQPSRTSTDHYVVIEAVTDEQPPAPVRGVRLELLFADGEVKTAQTDPAGIARVERIQAARVVIRVLDLDGELWKPADGGTSVASGTSDRPRTHVVTRGECLARIAHRYGLKSWQQLWSEPKNAPLRKKRKDPNVLLPGDEVVVPGVLVHEIARPTDATHRLIVKRDAELELDLVLEGAPGEPLADHTYALRYAGPKGPVAIEELKLDNEGRLRVMLPIQVSVVELEVVDLGETLVLQLGELDPAADADTGDAALSGVQQRLWALGYGGPPTQTLDDATRLALATFQTNELGHDDPSGEPDAATCTKLEELYGV